MNIKNYTLWTALVTPMTENGKVDYQSLQNLVRAQEKARNGLLVLGSTGEALNLDEDEKKQILEFVISLRPSSPIMVGVGGINLNNTLEWLKYCEELPVDAYLMVTPLYAKPGAHGQYHWFKALMDAVKRPCMLYNVPGRTGGALNKDALSRLNGHPQFWALKEASGSTAEFASYVQAAPSAQVFSGDDAMLPQYAPLGAKGLVSVASNVWPEQTHRYTELSLNYTLKNDKLWAEASNSLFVASNPVPVKCLMAEVGQISTPILRAPLTHEDMVRMDEVLKSHQNILNWKE